MSWLGITKFFVSVVEKHGLFAGLATVITLVLFTAIFFLYKDNRKIQNKRTEEALESRDLILNHMEKFNNTVEIIKKHHQMSLGD